MRKNAKNCPAGAVSDSESRASEYSSETAYFCRKKKECEYSSCYPRRNFFNARNRNLHFFFRKCLQHPSIIAVDFDNFVYFLRQCRPRGLTFPNSTPRQVPGQYGASGIEAPLQHFPPRFRSHQEDTPDASLYTSDGSARIR